MLVGKTINHVRLTVSMGINCKYATAGKKLLHKKECSIARKYVWIYREAVGMLSYIQGYNQPNMSIVGHQCARFCNNPHLVHECSVRRISKYLAITFTYIDLLDGNCRLSTPGVAYNPYK